MTINFHAHCAFISIFHTGYSTNFLNPYSYQLISIQSNIHLHKFTPSSLLHLYPSKLKFIHARIYLYLQQLCIHYLSLYFINYTCYKTVKVEIIILKSREFTDIDSIIKNINLLQNDLKALNLPICLHLISYILILLKNHKIFYKI